MDDDDDLIVDDDGGGILYIIIYIIYIVYLISLFTHPYAWKDRVHLPACCMEENSLSAKGSH